MTIPEVICLDPGSSSFKVGLSGQDIPQAIFPTVAGDGVDELLYDKARRPEVNALASVLDEE